MHQLRIISRFFSITFVTVAISGCAFNTSMPDNNDVSDNNDVEVTDNTFDELAARDVVTILKQIDTLIPQRTTLRASAGNLGQGGFADDLKQELQAAGYAMRFAGDGSASIPVSFEIHDEEGEDHTRLRTLTLFAGDIAVRRTYSIDKAGNILPFGAMQVRGADARNLISDSNIFSESIDAPAAKEPSADTSLLPVEKVAFADAPAISEVGLPLTSSSNSPPVVTPTGEAGLNDSISISSPGTDSSLLDLVAPSVPAPDQDAIDIAMLHPPETTENFMTLRESNFADLFAEMGIIREKVLTFPNDSTFMGNENKARLHTMLVGFNAQSDVLSVIGCSMGATNHAGGQEALARGRAMRVRDELLYAGIPEENILEEGCWGEEAFDQRMPRRGVVVTLKRRLG